MQFAAPVRETPEKSTHFFTLIISEKRRGAKKPIDPKADFNMMTLPFENDSNTIFECPEQHGMRRKPKPTEAESEKS